MSRIMAAFLCVVMALNLALSVCALGEDGGKQPVSISLFNTVAEYTPAGHRPTADAGDFSYKLRYDVTDDESGKKVNLPITEVGSYTVRAYITETATHGSAEAVANFTVTPAKVRLSVPNQSVAHTAMANPVRYSVYPAWAAGMVDVKISYRAIKSLSDNGKEVEVPIDMGSYLVHMEATPLDEKVQCVGKYLIYTVGEAYGGPESEEKALLSVPKEFKAQVQSLDAEYTGKPVVPEWSINAAGAESALMYSRIYADGTSGPYTKEPPTDPGDYNAACFVLDTIVGSGKIVINKVTVQIDMKDLVYTYSPEGVGITEATTTPKGIELKYNAYKYVNGKMGESVEFPLVDCGTYLISASPADTYRYSYTDSISYSYITINKANATIESSEVYATEDGKHKGVTVSVMPDYAAYSISYYKVAGNSTVPIPEAPTKEGNYIAVVSVKEDARVNSATAVYKVIIEPKEDTGNTVSKLIVKGLCYLFCLCSVGVALYHITLVNIIKRRKKA